MIYGIRNNQTGKIVKKSYSSRVIFDEIKKLDPKIFFIVTMDDKNVVRCS